MKKKIAVLMAAVMMATMPGLTVLAEELSDEIIVEELTEDAGLSDNSTSNDDLIIEEEDLANGTDETGGADLSENLIDEETESETTTDTGAEQDPAEEDSETDDADVSFVDDAGVSLVIEEITDFTGQDVDALIEAASDDAAEDIVDSGTCGDNLTWVLDGEGTLTISGTGEMSYLSAVDLYQEEIRTLAIEEGVTSIYVSAFSGCTNLTDVTIPESLTSIRTYAFENCTSLTSITVPSALIELGSGAFQGCTSLTDISITLSYDSERLSIGSHIFDDTAYYNDSANWENGLFYYGDYLMGADADQLDHTCEIRTGTTIIASDVFMDCSNISSINIPEGVKVICGSAFENCTALTTIDLPDSLIRLGADVFQGCEALTEINTGNNINAIGMDAFANTGFYNDAANWEDGVLYLGNYLLDADSDTLEGSYQVKEGTTLLSTRVFYGCSLLTEISIPDSVIMIQSSVFYGCTALTKVTVSGSPTIGNQAFYGCTGLTDIIFEGDAPYFNTMVGFSYFREDNMFFYNVTATVWYPAGNSTWTTDIMQNYGGTITWTAYETETDEDEITAQGTCGENLTWTLSASGVLTVSGTGDMTNFDTAENVSWNDYKELITSVVIETGVTSVGSNSFSGCTNLIQASLSDTVTQIGASAFENCSSLETLTLSANLESVGENAFENCSSLATVYYSGSSETWSAVDVGEGNSLLTEVVESSTNTDEETTEIIDSGTCGDDLTWTLDSDYVLTISGTGEMTSWSSYSSVPWYNYRTSIISISISEDITTIGNYAFYYCSSLKNITIPESVISIGVHAFHNCTGLTTAGPLGGEYDYKFGWTETIPDYAFYGCTGLTSITFPDSISTIGRDSFMNCTGITNIVLPDSVTTINYGAFWGCTGLISITTPNSVITIGERAFYNCTGLTGVTIPASITSIADETFRGCTGLTSMVIPENVTSIGESAFQSCTGLTSLTIPESVTSIGSSAFEGCVSLTTAGPMGGGYDYEFGWKETIPNCAFQGCTGLISIMFPETITSIGASAFRNCTGLTSITIPDNTSSVSSYAFADCTGLISITIPKSMTTFGNYVFSGCLGLTTAGLAGGDYSYEFGWEEDIPDRAFQGCTGLTDITIPESVTSIGASAFSGCTGLTGVIIPASVTTIGSYAFSDCTGMTSITIPASVTDIGFYTFENCIGLTTAGPVGGDYSYEYGWEETIPSDAFSGCTRLTSITFPEGVTSIGSYAFYSCSNLTSVTIPEGTTTIGSCAFYSCSSLTSVTISASVTTIGSNVFYGCNSLITAGPIGGGYNYEFGWEEAIPSCAFYGCSSLTSVTIPTSITMIGSSAFYRCSSLTSITIPASVTTIGDYAFDSCSSLTSVTIPASVTTIGAYSFRSCSSLTSITIPASVITIGIGAFYVCKSLTDVYYTGSEEDWANISIGSYNTYLTNATIHYNSTGSSDTSGSLSLTNAVEGGTNGLQISGILIEWDAVDGAASYYISRKSSDEDNYSTVAYVNDASTVSYFHVIYVYNGVTYTYRVQAQDENGNDLGEYEEGTITYVSPAVVSTPTIGTGGVTVSWTWGYTIDDSTYFNIFRKTDSTDWELIGTSTGYDYLDSEISVSVGDTYYYSVQVCCSYGTSAMSIAMGLDDTGLVLGDISVAKYMEYEIDGEEYEGYIEEYGALAIGDQVCFSIEVTTYVGVVLEFDETEWSSSNEEAIAFGTVSVAGPTVSEEDESRQVYYLTATAELLAGGNCTISFSMRGETSTSAEIIIASTYNCGDDLIWSLDTDGTMTISGTGEMWDYNLDTDEDGNLLNAPPWEEYYEKVSSIVIEDGVTSIGTYAFYCFAKVRFLTIGSGLQSVGAYGIDVSSDQYGTKIYFTGASPDIDKAAFGIENNVIDAYYIPSMDAIIWADTVSATYENALVSWISSEDLSGNLSASDVFPFNNSDTYFGDSEEGYYLSTSDCEKLMSNLNIIQKRAIKWYSTSGTNVYHYNLDGNGYLIRSYEEWGGSCSGMVHLIALGLNGCFSSSTFNSGASTYSDIDNGLAPVSKRTESIINFYQLQQYLPQYDDLKSSFMKKNQYAQLTILDDELEKTSSSTASGSAGAVMISFQLKNTDDSGQIKKEGHVIMGFAVEKGTFHVEINGQTYTFDHRVLTYDPSKCLDMFENKANWYFQQYSLYYYIGGGSSEARWAIPGYDIISTTNDIDIYSENDTANFKLVTSSLSVINAIDYSTGALNLTTEVKNAYLSAQSTSSFTVTTSENIAYVIKDGQIDGIGTVSDDIVVYVGDTDGGTTAYGSELTVSLSGIDKAYTLATDSSDSFSMLYENVALDAYCSSGGSSICFDPAGKVTLDADNVGECAVAITANEGYSSLEYPTIIVSGDNVSSLSAELTDEGDILIEGDNMSDVTISGDMLDGEDVDQVDISSDQDSVLISEDDNGNLTIYEDTDNDGLYDEVIAKMNGDISTCTVTLSSNNFTYNGIAQTPSVTVRSEDGTALAEETDYKVSYSDNINAGTASVIITGIGSYWGTVTKNFTISKANQTVSVSVAPTAIKVGETAKVTASGEGTLSYSSSDPSVASVDSSTGTVTGKKAGTVTITVTAAGTENYNSSSSEVAITVAAADSGGAGTGDSTSTGGDTTSDNTSTGSDATDDGTSTGDGTTGDDTSTSGDTTDGSSSSDNDMIVSDSSTDGGSSSGSDSSSGTMTEDRGAETIGSSYSDGSATYTVTSSDSSGRNVTITAVNTTASSTSTSVTIPESVEINGSGYTVTAIADNAFAGNTTLTTVSIGKNVTSIGANAFKNCTSLKTVKGCASVKIIGASAFQGCTALVTVKGMTNVTAVGSKAFYKCVKLTTIGSKSAVATLANVVTIGKSAFYGCKALKKVNLTSKTLASIGTSAFQGCTALKSFTAVSTKLKSIGKKAFYGDKKLTTVTLKTRKLTKSSVKANAFKGIKSSCTFRIPSSKVSAYKIIFRAKGAGSGIKVKKL